MVSGTIIAVCVLVALALFFDAVNGFHDTAHAVATSIASGALSYRKAVIMSGVLNGLGAFMTGTAVALFIPKIVDANHVTLHLIGAALFAGLVWNVITWFYAQPVSSTHCLLGSLIGAGVAAAGLHGVHWHELGWAAASLFVSPLVGFTLSFVLAKIMLRTLGEPGTNPKADKVLPYIQIVSAGAVSFAHGSNDGQKTMGIITMVLVAGFPGMYALDHVPAWVVLSCAVAIGLGTMIGGARVIHTVGHKLSNKKITSHDGVVAELVTASLVLWGGKTGLPLSTTQTCTGSVLGASKGIHGGGVNPETIKKIAAAWLMTFPMTASLAAASYGLVHWLF